jgi:hypothetical protein
MRELLFAAIVLLALMGNAPAQDNSPFDAAMQAEYMKLAQPGPEHEMLAKLAGTWNMTVTVWPAPGADPMKFGGTGHNEMILGGRFLQMTSVSGEGEMMTETLHLIGFDRRHNEFISAGFDTWGTYFVTARGPQDEKTGRIVMSGEDFDPVAGFTQVYDYIIMIEGEDKITFAVVFKNPELTGGADEFKMVEIAYERAR